MPATRKSRSARGSMKWSHEPSQVQDWKRLYESDIKHETLEEVQELSQPATMTRVGPFWESLSHEERLEMMTFSIKEVKAYAALAARRIEREVDAMMQQQQMMLQADAKHQRMCKPGCCGKDCGWFVDKRKVSVGPKEGLAQGLKRLAETGTWKLWQWNSRSPGFHTAESFREHVKIRHIDEALRPMLPKAEGTPSEQAALKGLTQRMDALMDQMSGRVNNLQDRDAILEAHRTARGYFHELEQQESDRIKEGYLSIIADLLKQVGDEDSSLYASIERPVARYVTTTLDGGFYSGSTGTDLFFPDVCKMPDQDIAKLCHWLMEKVHAIASGQAQVMLQIDPQLKAHHTSDDDDAGDVDVFILTEDDRNLTVNPVWLEHLQKRIMFDCGHVHLAQQGQDPRGTGAVLVWVFGLYHHKHGDARRVSQAPLNRKRTVQEDYEVLNEALQERHTLIGWLERAKSLVLELLESKREFAELALTYDLRLDKKPDQSSQGSDPPPPQADAAPMKAASTCITDEAPDDAPSHPSAASPSKPTCVSAPVSTTEPCLPGSTDAKGQSHAEKHQLVEAAAAAVSAAQCSQAADSDAQPDPACDQGPGVADTGESDKARATSSSPAGSDTDDSWQDARLPDHVVVALLKREHLLVRCHIHLLTDTKRAEEKRRDVMLMKKQQMVPEFKRLALEVLSVGLHFETQHLRLSASNASYKTARLCSLFPHLSKQAVQQQCATLDQSIAYGEHIKAVHQQVDELEQLVSRSAAELEQLHNRNQATLQLMDLFGHSSAPQPGAAEGASCHPGEQDTSAEACLQTDAHRNEQHCQDVAPQPSLGSKHQGSTQQPPPGSEALCVPQEPLAGCDAEGSNEDAAAWSCFAQDIWPALISKQLEAELFAALQAQLEEAEEASAGSRAAVIQLEAQLVNVACDDLGGLVWTSVLMPMLRERIESKAFQFRNKDALLAEQQATPMQAAEQKAAAARRAVDELIAAEEDEQQKAQTRARKGNQQRAKAKQQSAKLPAQAQLTQALPPQAMEQGEAGAQNTQAQQVEAIQTPPCEGTQEADADSAKANAKRAKKQRQKAKKQSAQQQAPPQQPAQQSSVPQQPAVAQQPEFQPSAKLPDAQQVDLVQASTGVASRQNGSDTARKGSEEATASLQGDDDLLMPQLPEADASAAYVPSPSAPSPDLADPGRSERSSPVLGKQPTGAPAAAALKRRTHDRSQLPPAVPSTFPGEAEPAAAASPPGLGFAISAPTQQKPKGQGQSAVEPALHPVTGSCQASSSPHVPAPEPQEAGPAADVAITWQQQSDVDKPAVQPNMEGATKSWGQKPALPTASSNTEVLDGILTPYIAPAEHVELLFQCPLTKAVMANPVIAADGHTYEQQAIHAWQQHHNTSPATGQRLAHLHLVQNAVIKSLIQQQMLRA